MQLERNHVRLYETPTCRVVCTQGSTLYPQSFGYGQAKKHIQLPSRTRTGLTTIASLSVDKPYQDLPTLRMDKSEAL